MKIITKRKIKPKAGTRIKNKLEQAEKPRMGRPPLGDDAHKLTLTLRVSQNELDAWTVMAKEQGMTVRTYILAQHRKRLKKYRE